jgi:hypothetical protein
MGVLVAVIMSDLIHVDRQKSKIPNSLLCLEIASVTEWRCKLPCDPQLGS